MEKGPGSKDAFSDLRRLLFAGFPFDEFLPMHVSPKSQFYGVYALIREGSFEKALDGLEAGSGDESERDPAYWLLTARAREGLGEGEAAVESLLRILQIQGVEARLWVQVWTILRELGHMPAEEENDALGVIVEVGLPKGLAVVAGFADGSSRMYWSSGGGIVAEASDVEVATAARNLVMVAAVYVPSMELAGGQPPADKGTVRFSVLTPAGVRVHSEGLGDVSKTANGYNRFFASMNELLARLRAKHLKDEERRKSG
jgi:hypothetical protein